MSPQHEHPMRFHLLWRAATQPMPWTERSTLIGLGVRHTSVEAAALILKTALAAHEAGDAAGCGRIVNDLIEQDTKET